jgi:hypothetical protein
MYVNAKMIPVATTTGVAEVRIKKSRGSECIYDIFDMM